MTITATIRQPIELTPYHGVEDETKLATLIASMRKSGWQGAPLLAWEGCGTLNLLTGSHRYAAAVEAGIGIPVITLSDDHDGRALLGGEIFETAREAWIDAGRCDWGVCDVSAIIKAGRPEVAAEYGVDAE